MKTRVPARLLFATLLLILCRTSGTGASGEYRTAEVASLKITLDSEWAPRTTPGYVPVRFDITNLGEPREIEIHGQGMRFLRLSRSFTQASFDLRRILRLARGDRVRFTIPVPVYGDSENVMFEVREGERSLERFNYTGFASGSRPEHASVLIVANAESAFGKAAARWPRNFSTVGGSSGGRVILGPAGPTGPSRQLDFVLAPSRLPDDWLGFTSLRAVAIGPTEWEQLNEAQKSALLTWTACGGDLFFIDGNADALFPERPLTPPEQPVRAHFFGRVHLLAAEAVTTAGLDGVVSKAAVLQDANWALPANRATDWGVIAARGFRLPIPGVEGIPARSYFLILVVFSILIGPINYWLLWRSRQQVFVVLTTPLVAAIFIVVLGGYVLAGEGLGVRGRAVSFTMLDQIRKQAATRTSSSLYAAGMAPSGGLRFARDEAVYTLGPDGEGSRESMSIELTEAQRLASGVIYARSPTNLETIAFRAARERLTFDRESGGIAVTNGVGVPVRSLTYRAGPTIYTLTAPLPPGQKGQLTAKMPLPADVVPGGLPLSARFEHLLAHLPDNTYLAVLERSPFWNPGVANVDERGSFHVLFGWVGGQP